MERRALVKLGTGAFVWERPEQLNGLKSLTINAEGNCIF